MEVSRNQRRRLEKDNQKYTSRFVEVPKDEWPLTVPAGLSQLWRNRTHLVQVYLNNNDIRLSVCITKQNNSGRWVDGLTWEDLQIIKRGVGYGDRWAVEIYPPDRDVVNVANMRHLWIPSVRIPLGWRND